MDMSDFFDKDKPLTRIKVQGAQVGGEVHVEVENQTYEEPVPDIYNGFDYAEKYKVEEEQLCLENANYNQDSDLFRPDTPTTLGTYYQDNGIDTELAGNIYSKYKFDRHIKINNLGINSYQEEITDLISSNSVVIIQGPTGCGKTTQVPQYILDYCQGQGKYCKIAVTQPRRIAAISVAKRVSEERGWPLSSIVGYQVALDNKTTEDTILTYMTTGVLLQKLVRNKNLNQYTHIIIDEVHERDAEMDFLLLVVRRFFRIVSTHVKIILMSATFDVDHFSNYFTVPKGKSLVPAPVLDVTKQQPYVVNIYYLNQFEQILGNQPMPPFSEPYFHTSLLAVVVRLIRIFDTFDSSQEKHGSVLIFLPGINEIEELYDQLVTENKQNTLIQWLIVPLHSSITIEEQRKAFIEVPTGQRKIILSTNIAESSITVPDVVYVIDFCLTKILVSDPITNYSSLKLMWASHTNCQQRSGRVGRVSSGRVYRLVPESFYQQNLTQDTEPEILRTPLQRLILLSKMLALNLEPHGILALAINPPALHNITQNIALLKEAGGLLPTVSGKYSKCDGDLTKLGLIMAQLPVDIHVSKLIVLGYMFSTLKECIIMGAAISLQNIFSTPFNERMKGYQSKLSWADCSCSDLIAYLHVYVVWERNKYNNSFRMQGGEKAWMKRNFLQPRVMKEWRILVQEIKTRLLHFGIAEPVHGREGNLTEHEKAMMLKVVICGAFYPHYFVRSSEGGQVDECTAVRQLGGRDPYTTVYLTGKPDNQPLELYVAYIRELLQECGQNMQLSHDNSNKIFIQFKHDMVRNERSKNIALIPGKIAIEVYNAVKYRHSKISTSIKCVSAEDAKLRVKQWKKQQVDCKIQNMLLSSILPGFEQLYIEIQVSHINNPGHFFVHDIQNLELMYTLNKIKKDLNSEPLANVTTEVRIGQLYAAPFLENYYRARVICIMPDSTPDENKIQVIFIDYGNIMSISKSKLKILWPEMHKIPPLALECVLTGIQPSHTMNIHALWSPEATDQFKRFANRNKFYGKVYSVVDDIVSLELYSKYNDDVIYSNDKTVNQLLVESGFAEVASESFLSQDNHAKREFVQNNDSCKDVYTTKIERFNTLNEMPPPRKEECRFTMNLSGPFSPLEMKVFSIVQCSLDKNVTIEWNSVNSVLLDTDPQDPHDRLLVAATVNQNVEGQKLSLRHTTMMPNIHGFPVLMAIMFCPKLELHTNKEGTRLTSILCGLGYDSKTNRSLFPSHDVALNLDFELTKEDILKVNEVRYFMNSAIESIKAEIDNDDPENASSTSIEISQNAIRKCIRELLKVKREHVDREVLKTMFMWNKLPPNVGIAKPDSTQTNQIWPLHETLILDGSNIDEFKTQANKAMGNFDDNSCSLSKLECQLCNIIIKDPTSMRIHLISAMHKQNEREQRKSQI